MNRLKRNTGVYRYLKAKGVLNLGADEVLKAKKIYWREYKLQHKRVYRKKNKAYTVYLNAHELQIVKISSSKHKRSITAYLKGAALAYSQQKFLVPDVIQVNTVKELLALNYTSVKKVFDEGLLPYELGKYLLYAIKNLEEDVGKVLEYPKLIENDP